MKMFLIFSLLARQFDITICLPRTGTSQQVTEIRPQSLRDQKEALRLQLLLAVSALRTHRISNCWKSPWLGFFPLQALQYTRRICFATDPLVVDNLNPTSPLAARNILKNVVAPETKDISSTAVQPQSISFSRRFVLLTRACFQ